MGLALQTQRSPMPGFGLGMGITLTMLSLIVILPVGALLAKGVSYGPAGVWDTVNTPRVWAALYLSFRLAFLAALPLRPGGGRRGRPRGVGRRACARAQHQRTESRGLHRVAT